MNLINKIIIGTIVAAGTVGTSGAGIAADATAGATTSPSVCADALTGATVQTAEQQSSEQQPRAEAPGAYLPSPEVIQSQKDFAADRFGIFIHWGIYSMFARGEWYLNYGPKADEYAKAARGFYPADFNAAEWISAIKDAGADCIAQAGGDAQALKSVAEKEPVQDAVYDLSLIHI